VPNPDFFLREESDGAGILYDPNSGKVRILNESSIAIWNLIDGQRSITQILKALKEAFGGIDIDAEKDALETIECLYRYGAVGLPNTEIR